jgi:hypothetical protein
LLTLLDSNPEGDFWRQQSFPGIRLMELPEANEYDKANK